MTYASFFCPDSTSDNNYCDSNLLLSIFSYYKIAPIGKKDGLLML